MMEQNIFAAVVEVLEYLLIIKDQTGCKAVKDEQLSLKLSTVEVLSEEINSFLVSVFSSKIDIRCEEFLEFMTKNAKIFTELVKEQQKEQSCSCLTLKAMMDDKMSVFSISIGNKDVECQEVEKLPYKNPYFEIRCQIYQQKDHFRKHCLLLHEMLSKVKLMRPHDNISFLADCLSQRMSTDFLPAVPSIRLGNRKLAINIGSYKRGQVVSGKIMVKCGSSFIFPPIKLVNSKRSIPVKVSVALAAVPPFSEKSNKLHYTQCRQINLLLYGPGGLPLFSPDNMNTHLIPLSKLLKLDDYGLRIEIPTEEHPVISDMKVSDLTYPLTCLDGTSPGGEYTLQLFFFFERTTALGTTDTIGLLETLRQTFPQLIQRQRGRIRKAVHSALNKLLHNVTEMEQKFQMYNHNIDIITDSIGKIISHSANVEFRASCFNALMVSGKQDMLSKIKENLKHISQAKLMTSVKPCRQQPSTSCVNDIDEMEDSSSDPSLRQETVASTSGTASQQEASQNFEKLGAHYINDDFSMFQDDMGGIEDIEAAELQLFDEVSGQQGQDQQDLEPKAPVEVDWFSFLVDAGSPSLTN